MSHSAKRLKTKCAIRRSNDMTELGDINEAGEYLLAKGDYDYLCE